MPYQQRVRRRILSTVHWVALAGAAATASARAPNQAAIDALGGGGHSDTEPPEALRLSLQSAL
jgi:hypothetical protein